jgi:3-hydroxybutyryl-CoA dehydrogenase
MKKIGIIGAGTMGAGIAHVAALSGFSVLLYDVSNEILNNGLSRITKDLNKGLEKGKLTQQQLNDSLQRISLHSSLEVFSEADIVIEAAIEQLEIKKEIFKKLGEICPPAAVLASNTSSFSITALASAVTTSDRVVGMHFFNPVHLMKLVEIIRGHHTSEYTIKRTLELAKALGKVPVITKDTPGFIVNRIARPFYGEALRLLGEGVASVEDIDKIVRLEGGFKMGPFELMDLIGIDVNFAVTQSMYEQTFGEARYRPHIIQKTMVEAKLLGRKTKRGFYDYGG